MYRINSLVGLVGDISSKLFRNLRHLNNPSSSSYPKSHPKSLTPKKELIFLVPFALEAFQFQVKVYYPFESL